jgi:hypothetical protein
MNPTLKKWLIGALAGGAGGAGLSGLLAHSKRVKGESKKQRRKRIMRQALLGGGLGAGVGSLPAGISALSSASSNPSLSFKPSTPGSDSGYISNKIPGVLGQFQNAVLNHKPFSGQLNSGFDLASIGLGGAGALLPGAAQSKILEKARKEIGNTTNRQLNTVLGKLNLTGGGSATDGSKINNIANVTGRSSLRDALLSKDTTGGTNSFTRNLKAYNLLRNSGLEHSRAAKMLGKQNTGLSRVLRAMGMRTSGGGTANISRRLQARGIAGQGLRGIVGYAIPQLLGQGAEAVKGTTDSNISTRQGQAYALGVIRNIEDKLRSGNADFKPSYEDVTGEMRRQISSGQLESGMGLTDEAVKAFFDPVRRDAYGAGGDQESIGGLADDIRKSFSNYGLK